LQTGRLERWKELSKGWPLLLTATLGCATSVPVLISYSIGTFIQPLQHEFGWTRADITAAQLWLGLTFAATAPALGWLVDLVGPRRLAVVSILISIAPLGLLSQFNGGRLAFYLLFCLAGLVGGGTTPIVYTQALNARFARARGLALGLALAGQAAIAMVLPPLLAFVIINFGWRASFIVLGCLVILPWPFAFLLMPKTTIRHSNQKEALGVSARDAIRSRVFWTIALAFFVISMAAAGWIVHMVPFLRDSGFEPLRAASIASLVGVGSLLARIAVGFLVDHFFAPRIVGAIVGLAAVGCSLVAGLGANMAPVAAFLVGFAFGAEIDVVAYLTARYFGMRRYGLLYGSVYAIFIIGGSLGPFLIGRIFDHFGNYSVALRAIVILFVTGAAALFTLPQFKRDFSEEHAGEARLPNIP
jgi:MFS family permease